MPRRDPVRRTPLLLSGSRRLSTFVYRSAPLRPFVPLAGHHSPAAGREDRSDPGVRKSTPERHPPPRVFSTSTPGRSRNSRQGSRQDGRTRSSRFLSPLCLFRLSFSFCFPLRDARIGVRKYVGNKLIIATV